MFEFILSHLVGLFFTTSVQAVVNQPVVMPDQVVYDAPLFVNSAVPAQCWEFREIITDELEKEWDVRYTSLLVSQMRQESSCRCDLDSPFAMGCAQFTKATGKAMARTDCRDLGKFQPRNIHWALPCMVRLHLQNAKRVGGNTECDHMMLVLRCYNEGCGWTRRAIDKAYDGGDYESVAAVSIKAGWAEHETDNYVEKIAHKWQPSFIKAGYGGEHICKGRWL